MNYAQPAMPVREDGSVDQAHERPATAGARHQRATIRDPHAARLRAQTAPMDPVPKREIRGMLEEAPPVRIEAVEMQAVAIDRDEPEEQNPRGHRLAFGSGIDAAA